MTPSLASGRLAVAPRYAIEFPRTIQVRDARRHP